VNKAVKSTASLLGASAGIAGLEHGYFELQQGIAEPGGIFISSIGPPCDPELIWNRCEPALTLIPNFAISGILSMILGLIIVIWSLFFVQRKYGGQMLIVFSILLLLFGGGLFPPLIGIIAGLAGTRINKTLTWTRAYSGGSLFYGLSRLYPWALLAYLVLVLGQWIIGYFFNEWLMANMGINVVLILIILLLSVPSAIANDIQKRIERQSPLKSDQRVTDA
jgi:hypothetical protein